ncbi:MAG: hypothetical protein ABI655_00010 [Phenylobacterium sp.]
MRRRAILSLIATCALGACVSQQTPSQLGGMSWSLGSNESEGAKLVFGAPNTDDVVMMLTCLPRSGAVQVWLTGAGARSIELKSGAATSRLASRDAEDYAAVVATAKPNDPALMNFARTGRLAVAAGGSSIVLPGHPGDAGRFLTSCVG